MIELVARWIVVSYVKSVVSNLRNLYWLREIEAPDDSLELKLLRPLRMDGDSLVEIARSRELGVPTFVIGALLIPLGATIYRLTTGFAFQRWQAAAIVGAVGIAIGSASVDRAPRDGDGGPADPALGPGAARGGMEVGRLLREAAEGPLAKLRDRRDHADDRRLDHPADDRRHRHHPLAATPRRRGHGSSRPRRPATPCPAPASAPCGGQGIPVSTFTTSKALLT